MSILSSDSFLESKLNNFNKEMFIDQHLFFDDFYLLKRKEILNQIKSFFELADIKIRNSQERKKAGWIIKDERKRTLIFEEGPVCFKRTRYKNKYTSKYKCLVDDYLQISKYQRLIDHFRHKILDLFGVGEGCNYRQIVNNFKNSGITSQTVSNIIKSFKIDKYNTDNMFNNKLNKELKNINENTYFHLETDDTFFSLKEGKEKVKYRLRLFVIHNGVEQSFNKRKILKNKTFFYILKKQGGIISQKDMIILLNQHMIKYYKKDLSSIDNLIVHGDGASWIKILADNLGRKVVLDKFHLFKEIRNVFSFSSKVRSTKESQFNYFCYKKITNILKNYKDLNLLYEELKNISKQLKESKNPKFKDFVKLCGYISRNEKGIENMFLYETHTESQISCLIKQIFSYNKKIYSLKTFKNILYIKQIKINGFNFVDLLDNTRFDDSIEGMKTTYVDPLAFNSVGKVNAEINKYNRKVNYPNILSLKFSNSNKI